MEVAFYTVLALCLAALSQAYPFGPPTEGTDVCTHMFPTGHNATELNRKEAVPFQIAVHPVCYKKGSKVEITVSTTVDDENVFFEGLFIQARDYPDKNPNAYGMFSTDDPDLKLHNCFDKPNSALSQSRADHYFTKTFYWEAGDHELDLIFVSTMVFHTDQFWLDVVSPRIVYDPYCGENVQPPTAGAGITFMHLPTMLSVLVAGVLALYA